MNEEEKKAIEILNTLELRRKTKNYKEISLEDSQSVEIVLNLVEKLQKENIEQKAEIERRKHDNKTLKEFVSAVFNEELNNKYILTDKQNNAVIENAQNDINQKWIQKVEDKIEELQKEYNKLDKQVDEYIKSVEKDVSTYYENKERISIMQTLSYFIDTLQELIEEREGK